MVSWIRRNLGLVLGLVIAALAVVIAIQQLQIQRQQFEYELLQKPTLVYSSGLVLSKADHQAVSKAEEELTGNFFKRVYEYAQSHVGITYQEAIRAVLPLTTTLPARPVSVITLIRNNGQATANKVRAIFEIDRPITSFDVKALEPFSAIRGGVGERQITIEVDRVAAGDTVTITIAFQVAENQGQLDQVVLDQALASPFEESFKKDTSFGNGLFSNKKEISFDNRLFSNLRYIPAQGPSTNVVVTSSEGKATLLATLP